MENPEMLLRTDIHHEFKEKASIIDLKELSELLETWVGVWWNAYAREYGLVAKNFPYPARNGFFVNTSTRLATHRFISKGIVRRDTILEDHDYVKIVPPSYRDTWFDVVDAQRTYSIIITQLNQLKTPIPIEEFGLFQSWGKVSKNDAIKRPRLIKANFPFEII